MPLSSQMAQSHHFPTTFLGIPSDVGAVEPVTRVGKEVGVEVDVLPRRGHLGVPEDLLDFGDVEALREQPGPVVVTKLMHNIVTYRAEHGLPTIVTSNEPLLDAAKKELIDLRIVYRLAQGARTFNVRGVNWRERSDGARELKPAFDLGDEIDPDPYRDLGREEREAQEAARMSAHKDRFKEEERQYTEGKPLFKKAALDGDDREWNRLRERFPAIAMQMEFVRPRWNEIRVRRAETRAAQAKQSQGEARRAGRPPGDH